MNFLLRLLRQVPPLLTGIVQSLALCTPRSSTPIDISSSSESLVISGHSVHLPEESGPGRDQRLVTINVLPDDMLLEIFVHVSLTAVPLNWYFPRHTSWHTVTLVHVCRRWRYLAFASPRHLNLKFNYGAHRPMSEMLDVWPGLPVTMTKTGTWGEWDQRWDNMLAALESEHYKRFSEIHIEAMTKSHWERFAAAMQKPFPELTHLEVWTADVVRVLPDSFLGGSAPHLRTLSLRSIPFPSIPKLLLSANRLVTLYLWDIPDSGYFSPDGMAAVLTVMTRLESLHLQFHSPRSRPDLASQPLPPPTRFVLPALTKITFKGDSEYLEVLLARIDAPRLYHFLIEFFMGLDFDVPQLHRFIRHAEVFNTIDYAEALLCWDTVHLNLYPNTAVVNHRRWFALEIGCRELDGQLSSLAQVCSSFTPLISTLEVFKFREQEEPRVRISSRSHWNDDIEDTRWLKLLDPFTGLKDLYLTSRVARHVCRAFRNLSGQRATEVLPALRNLFVPASLSLQSVREAMMARQLSGHPVVVDHWEGKFANLQNRTRGSRRAGLHREPTPLT